MGKVLKKISVTLVLTLLVSVFASTTVIAASEKRIETKQGGYVTVSNIVEEIKFTDEGAGVGNTIYVANGPVTIRASGDNMRPITRYYPNAQLSDGFFLLGDTYENINNGRFFMDVYTKLVEPGYYSVSVQFDYAGRFSQGSSIESTSDNTAAFVIQIVGEPTTKTKPEPKPELVEAKPTSSKVLVNSKEISFEAYNINNNNYFKLRDLAMVVNGTDKSFAVSWDGVNNAISLESGNEYISVGGELVVSDEPSTVEAKLTTSKIYLDGEEVDFTAYNINGNNYFKLRDVAKVINFGVTWDGSTNMIGIDSKSDYKE
jgi:hypothetical protein